MSVRFVSLKAVSGAVVAMALMGSSAALAETCTTGPAIGGIANLGTFAQPIGSIAGAAVSSIQTASTAFLLQSTAFVSGPPNPQPDQQGGGVWVRGVGGGVRVKDPSTTAVTAASPALAAPVTGAIACNTQIDQTFGGVQVGQDVARLNVNGWNVHIGGTAGYLEARSNTVGNNAIGGYFNSNVQAPFVGSYIAVSRGGFFADLLLRGDYYQNNLDSPSFNIFNQKLGARGISIASSAGYHYTVPNSQWFIEPSAGLVWSRTTVDPMNLTDWSTGIQGTLRINAIQSTIGRIGARIGTTIVSGNMAWQPFAAASVWHEFERPATASYTTCTGCAILVPPGAPITITGAYRGTSIGTYGQFSLGIAGQVLNTGWVGFARADYRTGSQIQGWDLTGGLRYHFNPELAAVGKMPTKAAPMAMPSVVNWTGGYAGIWGGADFGRGKLGFAGVGTARPIDSGVIGGVTLGYNHQFGQWVAGVEADWGLTNLRGSKECVPLTGPFVPLANTTCHSGADWIATLTGRLGFTWQRALFYGKFGGAWARETFSVTCNVPGLTCPNAAGAAFAAPITANGANRLGWTIGYGVEYAMSPRWSAKGETTYTDFGSRNVTASNGSVINTGLYVFTAKVGVNFKLF